MILGEKLNRKLPFSVFRMKHKCLHTFLSMLYKTTEKAIPSIEKDTVVYCYEQLCIVNNVQTEKKSLNEQSTETSRGS